MIKKKNQEKMEKFWLRRARIHVFGTVIWKKYPIFCLYFDKELSYNPIYI